MNLDTKKISDLIIATGKSHAEFAKAAQLTANTIYNVVNTGKAHPRTIKKIAQALDVPPSSLYEGTEEIKPPEVELLPKAWDVLPSKELLLMLSDMICEMSVLDPHWLPERERRKAYMAAHGFSGLTLCEDGIRRLDLSKIERNKVIDG